MNSHKVKLSSFSNCGQAAGVRRGKQHMHELAVAMQLPVKPTRKRCMCGQRECRDNCVICPVCWKTAPMEAKRDSYSRDLNKRRAAARVLCQHAFTFNANYRPVPSTQPQPLKY